MKRECFNLFSPLSAVHKYSYLKIKLWFFCSPVWGTSDIFCIWQEGHRIVLTTFAHKLFVKNNICDVRCCRYIQIMGLIVHSLQLDTNEEFDFVFTLLTLKENKSSKSCTQLWHPWLPQKFPSSHGSVGSSIQTRSPGASPALWGFWKRS